MLMCKMRTRQCSRKQACGARGQRRLCEGGHDGGIRKQLTSESSRQAKKWVWADEVVPMAIFVGSLALEPRGFRCPATLDCPAKGIGKVWKVVCSRTSAPSVGPPGTLAYPPGNM